MSYATHDLEHLERTEAYKLFITAIVPRPIGWLSTMSRSGISNAAPFSWFNAVCADPLMVMAAIGKRAGALKDTARNIQDTGEFVVNVATDANAKLMVQSSADYGAETSEFDAVGLTPLKSDVVAPPRIAESPIHIECKLDQIIEPGNGATSLILGRCVKMHIADSVLGDDGRVDANKLRPLARLGRDEYSTIGQILHFPRPTV